MNELSVSPNECFAGSNAIKALVSAIEDYDAIWYLTRTQKEQDEVTDSFRQSMRNKYKDLHAQSNINIPEDTEAETKASLAASRESAKTELDDKYRKDGDIRAPREMHQIPHSKVFAHVPPHMRHMLKDLMPFLTTPKEIVE